MGAISSRLIISSPVGGSTVTSPTLITGHSTSFEGVIKIEMRSGDGTTSLGQTTATGGSMGTMAPFTTSVTFSHSSGADGALVATDISPQDGSVLDATVVAVAFG